jgi:hypothetical protein
VPVPVLVTDVSVATPLWLVIVTEPLTVATGRTAWTQDLCWYRVSVLVPPICRAVGTLTCVGVISKRMLFEACLNLAEAPRATPFAQASTHHRGVTVYSGFQRCPWRRLADIIA